MSRKSKRELEEAIARLERDHASGIERWVRALTSMLPPRECLTLTVESIEEGQLVYVDPEAVIREADGVMWLMRGKNRPTPPDGWTHVASGPKGISSDFVHKWDLYVDLETHTPPRMVNTSNFPVEILLARGSAFGE